MTIKNKSIIKFTKDDIASIYLDSHKYDRWATIVLNTGVEIRSHSAELEQLILHKAIVATYMSRNGSEDFVNVMNISLSLAIINNYSNL